MNPKQTPLTLGLAIGNRQSCHFNPGNAWRSASITPSFVPPSPPPPPRGATRLLNTYRLLRAGIPATDWNDFRGNGNVDGEFRLAMLLLASAAGYPAEAREWFKRLRDLGPEKLLADTTESDTGWCQFRKMFQSPFSAGDVSATKRRLAHWLDQVERYMFLGFQLAFFYEKLSPRGK